MRDIEKLVKSTINYVGKSIEINNIDRNRLDVRHIVCILGVISNGLMKCYIICPTIIWEINVFPSPIQDKWFVGQILKHRLIILVLFSIYTYFIHTYKQGNKARKVNCCCVFSAYILKPVLSGLCLLIRIDESVFL